MHAIIEGFTVPSDEAVQAAAGRFRLLGDPTRLRVLCALAQGETSVACLAELAGAGVPTVSQHLAKLRLAGIVRARRDGVFVFHELVDDEVHGLLVPLMAAASAEVGR
jgi:DNA-binding transcriptional ArsR family regulator